jgi:hypothetical protein
MGTSGEDRMLRGAGARRARNRRGSLRARRRIAAACLAGCLLIAGATLAQADPIAPGVPVDQPTTPDDPTAGVLPDVVDPNPCTTANKASSGATAGSCDTQYTPTAKDGGDLFKQLGGAECKSDGTTCTGTQPIARSYTPVTVDFYAVRFSDPNNGYAGGAACPDDTPFDKLDPDSPDACTRVPVIWQYTNKLGEGALWREVYRGTGQGFVAAIAYVKQNRHKAIAVGGSGIYPYREFSKDTTSDPDHDPSGHGRVWETNPDRFGDSDWHEYSAEQKPTAPNLPADPAPFNAKQEISDTADGQRPSVNNTEKSVQGAEKTANQPTTDFGPLNDALDNTHGLSKPVDTPMRALTAVDCSPLEEFCVAGGIQQLFMWNKGTFDKDKTYGNGSPDSAPNSALSGNFGTGLNNSKADEVQAAANFRFRVRRLRFVPGDRRGSHVLSVVGVTSGCCDANPANNLPRVLYWDNWRWVVTGPALNSSEDRLPQSIPDSFYSLSLRGGAPSVIASSGGPPERLEPTSQVLGDFSTLSYGEGKIGAGTPGQCAGAVSGITSGSGGACNGALGGTVLSGLHDSRLVAGDTDLSGPQTDPAQLNGTGGLSGPDGFIDWAVGEKRSTGQALAYTTTIAPHALHVPSPLDCPTSFPDTNYKNDLNCKPASSDDIQKRAKSVRLFLLPSYRLNDIAPASSISQTGTDWAVGDKGAIVRIGGSGDDGAALPDPVPPHLGSPKPAQTPPSNSYDEQRPAQLTGQPGELPPLNASTETKSQPEIVPWGSPQTYRGAPFADNVASIVTSRDGSEAWALGSGVGTINGAVDRGRTTLYHYAGGAWTPCDAIGVAEQLAPDPACSGLEPLLHNMNGPNPAPVRLIAATRVPLENDADPANDDEFEVVAIAHSGQSDAIVIAYRNGRWSIDEQAMREISPYMGNSTAGDLRGISIAFSGPDDGWLTTNDGDLLHFGGAHWSSCNGSDAERVACGDDPAALILPGAGGVDIGELHFRLLQVSTRTYLYGAGRYGSNPAYPLILHKDPGGHWSDGTTDGFGYNPGCAADRDPTTNACVPAPEARKGSIDALTVTQNGDGTYSGWASGWVEGSDQQKTIDDTKATLYKAGVPKNPTVESDTNLFTGRQGLMLHLGKSSESSKYTWTPWSADDATADYPEQLSYNANMPQLLSLPGKDGEGVTLLMRSFYFGNASDGPMLWFNPAHRRWEIFHTPFQLSPAQVDYDTKAQGRALVSDGQGGAWMAVLRVAPSLIGYPNTSAGSTFFYRYTNQVPKPVFHDVPHPAQSMEIAGSAADPDGGFWLATRSSTVFRYDRATGWDKMSVPGWDPGRIATVTSVANAIAFGSNGEGLLVGQGGRIADLTKGSAILDPAAGRSCGRGDPPPCGTGRDLFAAAVAPNGSALIGGDARVVLWRGASGVFHTVEKPPASLTARITGIAMPSANQAWLCTDHGEVFLGEKDSADHWSWRLENDTPDGVIINTTYEGHNGEVGTSVPFNAIAVDRSGFGYAVGDDGVVLERSGSGAHPWHRLAGLPLSRFQSVTIAPGGHQGGALIGGDYGLVLTRQGNRFEVAHQADAYAGVNNTYTDYQATYVPGLALVPGERDGTLEAWAVEQFQTNPDPRLRFSSDRSPGTNALLHFSSDPGDPLLDGADGRAGALADAPAHRDGELSFAAFGKSDCSSPVEGICTAPAGTNLESDLIPKRIDGALTDPGARPDFTLFTGDAVQGAGDDHDLGPSLGGTTTANNSARAITAPNLDPSVLHHDWAQAVADPLLDAGIPLFGAAGRQDLAKDQYFDPLRGGQGVPHDPGGTNLGWRQAMAAMPAPWGTDATKPQQRNGITWQTAEGEDDSKKTANDATQARTHYAVDGIRDGHKVIRLVVADTSRGSLTASDPLQNPPEEQQAWLDKVLCIKGSVGDTGSCTREPTQQAVLMTETPTYSYGPGGVTDVNAIDGNQLEALIFKDQVNAVIQGKLGWNGLYWSCPQCNPPHSPTPGGAYPAGPPSAPVGQSPVPFIIASGAGGKFAQDATDTSASNGYWHGYTLVRLSPDGDPTKTIVEQRPILDWLLIQGKSHMLRPGQSVQLEGTGREPVSTDTPVKYDDISTPAVTHCYDLVLADPAKPWLPLLADDASDSDKAKGGGQGCRSRSLDSGGFAASAQDDECEPYICLNSGIGTIDDQSGMVKAGAGAQERTFALALLSVGGKSATYPISFEPRASFRQAPAPPPLPVPPATTPPPAPAPPAPAPPFQPPTLATPPPLTPLPAQTPPIPPVPPAPPNGGPAQLDLFTSPPVLSVAPTLSLFPPSAPVINVAPPTPARPVEKAKKVAVQSSGSDSDAKKGADAAGDLASSPDSPTGTAFSRNEPNSFTAIAHRDQASAWARDLQWGGGLTLMALVAAFGWITVRPTPRRRQPEVPSPAFSHQRWR